MAAFTSEKRCFEEDDSSDTLDVNATVAKRIFYQISLNRFKSNFMLHIESVGVCCLRGSFILDFLLLWLIHTLTSHKDLIKYHY